MSCADTRNRLPIFRTLPSSTVWTIRRSPISRMSTVRCLNRNDEVRAATDSPLIRASALINSSAIPSQKYSCSGSALMFANGSTAIDGPDGRAVAAASARPGSQRAQVRQQLLGALIP